MTTQARRLRADFSAKSVEAFLKAVDYDAENTTAEVKVLKTDSKWFGVTYSEDRPEVVAKFAQLHADGTYPEKLF